MPDILTKHHSNIQHAAQSHAKMKHANMLRTCDCVTAEEDMTGWGRHHQQSTDDDDEEFKQVMQR